MSGFWTEERVSTLGRLAKSGQSAAQIADALGCSRSAVVGRIYRMKGVSLLGRRGGDRTTGTTRAQSARPKPKPSKTIPALPAAGAGQKLHLANIAGKKASRRFDPGLGNPTTPADARAYDDASRALPQTALRLVGDCKFPVNDAALGETHLFCGKPSGHGSWCAHHRGRVFGQGTKAEQNASEIPGGVR